MRNYELGKYSPSNARELAQATSWREVRRIVTFQRARIRSLIAKKDLAAAALVRYVGVQGTDWKGEPLDRREYSETKRALDFLTMLQVSQFEQHNRYSADLPVGILVGKDLPARHGIVVKVNKRGTAWFGWRRTVAGWCVGVGASGVPPNKWTYQDDEPPTGYPRKWSGWEPGEFELEIDSY